MKYEDFIIQVHEFIDKNPKCKLDDIKNHLKGEISDSLFSSYISKSSKSQDQLFAASTEGIYVLSEVEKQNYKELKNKIRSKIIRGIVYWVGFIILVLTFLYTIYDHYDKYNGGTIEILGNKCKKQEIKTHLHLRKENLKNHHLFSLC